EVAAVYTDLDRAVGATDQRRHGQHGRAGEAAGDEATPGWVEFCVVTHTCYSSMRRTLPPVNIVVQSAVCAEGLYSIRLRISNNICAPAWAVLWVASYSGATSTTSPPMMSSPLRPRSNCSASRVVRPPISG